MSAIMISDLERTRSLRAVSKTGASGEKGFVS